ncbi:TRAP transporter small permease [Halobellus rarus]|uniref:TRAP transporter small permease n=1 Tax=Halobellus rarus TaxID=1126237 RepID=A0ABD6CTC7_9EURY
MILITISTLGRYLFGSSIPDLITTIEIYLMVGLVFLASSRVQWNGGNVATLVIARKVPDRYRRVTLVIANILTIMALSVIVFSTASKTWELIETGATKIGVINYPTAHSWILLPIGFSLLIVRIIQQTSKLITADSVSDQLDQFSYESERDDETQTSERVKQ